LIVTDLLIWGGPVYCSTADKVEWLNPTVISCKSLTGTANGDYYFSLKGQGSALDAIIAKAMAGEQPENIGIAGFSAFHNFANPMLKDDTDRSRIAYIHLADACFDGVGATSPKQGYLAAAIEAIQGDKLMVSTTSGVPGVNVTYSKGGGGTFTHKNGHDSFKLVWDAALEATGASEVDLELPDLPAAPVWAKRAGNLIWLSYEQTIKHEDHANLIAVPLMNYFGAPWMQGRDRPTWKEKVFGALPLLVVAAIVGAWMWVRRA